MQVGFISNLKKILETGGRPRASYFQYRGWWYYNDKSSESRFNQGLSADLVLQKKAFG
jgi:hypothetical protein